MDQYIVKEPAFNSLLGPFVTLPWQQYVAVSPMSMTSKKNSTKRHIIMDLSWPHDGTSVNAGIPKDKYMDQPINIVYPTIDTLCK